MPAIDVIEKSSEPIDNPPPGSIYQWADDVTGLPKIKDSAGVVYDQTGPTGAAGPAGPTGPAGPAGPGSILDYSTSSAFLENNSASTWLDFGVTLNFTPPSAGLYDLEASYIWSLNDTGQNFMARFLINGTPLQFHVQEPKDKDGPGDGGTDQRPPVKYSEPVTLVAGVNVLKLQFKPSANNKQAAIHRGTLYIKELP